jgi:hypothetical protein
MLALGKGKGEFSATLLHDATFDSPTVYVWDIKQAKCSYTLNSIVIILLNGVDWSQWRSSRGTAQSCWLIVDVQTHKPIGIGRHKDIWYDLYTI